MTRSDCGSPHSRDSRQTVVFPFVADQIRKCGYHLAFEPQAKIAWIREQQHFEDWRVCPCPARGREGVAGRWVQRNHGHDPAFAESLVSYHKLPTGRLFTYHRSQQEAIETLIWRVEPPFPARLVSVVVSVGVSVRFAPMRGAARILRDARLPESHESRMSAGGFRGECCVCAVLRGLPENRVMGLRVSCSAN
jgi:hypothetical protein